MVYESLNEKLQNSPLYVFHTFTDHESLKYTLFLFITTYTTMQAYLTAGTDDEC
ncbi:hypothetical protein [Methanobacterium petrolearium]|uniref:hypothetical protein n=1 Tax=Methanobacterium petrolearium TaxID=710190 RepID=UPI001AE47BF9|nr:hypothetical protein [Methanobacterium petrolearium]MBP1946055.1 hypothetical protein [Methanobacterium petrolearium]